MSDIRIVLRGKAAPIDHALSLIAVAFETDPGAWASKYGTAYENDVFMMHPYCWCEAKECLWCTIWLSNEEKCTEEEANAHRDKQISQVEALYGKGEHQAPNFFYKPTGLALRWYKYIGRDTECNQDSLPPDWLERIFASHPTGMTIEQAVAKLVAAYAETTAMWEDIAKSVGATIVRE